MTKREPMIFDLAPSRARRKVMAGDIIVSTVRTYLRAIAPVPKGDETLIVSTGFAVVRPRKANSGYLSYALRESSFVESVVARSVGVSYPAVNASEVGDISIPLPSKPEQTTIADFLDRETGRIDTLTAKRRALIGVLKEKRTALIFQTVTRGLPADVARKFGLKPHIHFKDSGIEWLGEVPEEWEFKKLSWLFKYCKGRNAATLTREYIGDNPGDYPVFSGQTENNGLMGMIDSFEFEFTFPVIFVTTVGARAMSTRLVDGKFSLSQNCALIIPRSGLVNATYFQGVLQRLFDFERRSISLIMQPSLRFEDLNRFWVPLPSSAEQAAVATYLDRETIKIDKLIQKVEAAIERLYEYRMALITAAVTGKIDVRKEAA